MNLGEDIAGRPEDQLEVVAGVLLEAGGDILKCELQIGGSGHRYFPRHKKRRNYKQDAKSAGNGFKLNIDDRTV